MRSIKLSKFAIPVILLLLLFSPAIEGFAQSKIDVAVHFVEGIPAEDGNSYDVTAYFSVVDGLGTSIADLTGDAFTVTEDSQRVEIQKLGRVENEPINIVLVIDTSGSMAGYGITDTKAAVISFVSTLKPNDQVAIITFNNGVNTLMNFSMDRRAITDQIEMITSVNNSGTCLYDAAYSAIQMASTLSSGSRAVILFTDGKEDTRVGKICSIHTIDDVIGLSSGGGTRTPIYTLGMGTGVDENILKRIAAVTGGLYLHSSQASEIANIFQRLSDQLRSQYVLAYKSFAGTGPHTLSVSVIQFGLQDTDTRNFVLPLLPTRIVFLNPQEGDTVGDSLSVMTSLISQGETVERVAFDLNGAIIGADTTKPYELELDLKSYPAGIITITAIAYGAGDTELARNSLSLIHAIPDIAPLIVIPTEIVSAAPAAPTVNIRPIVLLGIGIGGLGIFTILLLTFVLVRQQQREKAQEEVDAIEDKIFLQSQNIPAFNEVQKPKKIEKWGTEPNALGTLTVESSDDETLLGHRFYIVSERTTLGRSADNDINFPKDNPVSRQHAEIFEKSGRLFLKEVQSVDSSGENKSPKYGTFINDRNRVGTEPVLLRAGDEILLGKRVRLKFEAGDRLRTVEASTYDDMTAADDIDRTQTQS